MHEMENSRHGAGPRGGSLLGRIFLMVAATGSGALTMFYADPHAGRRRRALLRDKLVHVRKIVTRDVPDRARQRSRFMQGVAKGVQHNALGLVRHERHGATDDDVLVSRVRSEVLRDAGIKSGQVHVDAYRGCVTLRGELENEIDIRHVEDLTRRIPGVEEVRNYLHLPETLPKNKEAAYADSERRMPSL